MLTNNALLHLSDWNFEDKYYRVPIIILIELRRRIKAEYEKTKKIEESWDWFQAQINYDSKNKKLPKFLKRIPTNEDALFLDYTNPLESVNEWEI